MVDVNFTSCKALDATITIDLSLVDFFFRSASLSFSFVGDVDVGTPLGATAVVAPGSAGYLLWECCILASL